MSLPIKSTPTLRGEDAERFLKQIKENENKKVSPEEIERIKKNYEIMQSIIVKSPINDNIGAILNDFINWVKQNYSHSKGGYRHRGDFERKDKLINLQGLKDRYLNKTNHE